MAVTVKRDSAWPFGRESRRRSHRSERTAVVFGSGGARGWAHIGVLKAFREIGFRPDIVAGTSIGSVAAAVLAVDALDNFLKFSEDFDWFKAAHLFVEFGVHRGGLVEGRKIAAFLESMIPAKRIEDLPIPFAAVATDLFSSEEVVFRDGPLVPALRASVSIPGVFTPVELDGRHLVDGGLVNPLPLDVVREMGATHIVAVNINNGLVRLTPEEDAKQSPGNLSHAFRTLFQGMVPAAHAEDGSDGASDPATGADEDTASRVRRRLAKGVTAIVEKLPGRRNKPDGSDTPDMNLFDVFTRSLRIAEDRITAACIERNPPDVLIEPDVGDIPTMDFSRATESIEAGYVATREVLEQ